MLQNEVVSILILLVCPTDCFWRAILVPLSALIGQASKLILVSVKLIHKTKNNDQFSIVLRLKPMHLNVWSNGNHNRLNEAIIGSHS